MYQLQVENMTCGHCVSAVTKAVQSVDPQAQVQIEQHAQSRAGAAAQGAAGVNAFDQRALANDEYGFHVSGLMVGRTCSGETHAVAHGADQAPEQRQRWQER